MIRLKLILLGIMLNFIAAYPFDPIVIPPAITSISGVTHTGFTVNWSSGQIIGLSNNYFLTYVISVEGPGGSSAETGGNSASFGGLEPSTAYSITLRTYATILGPVTPVYFPSMESMVTTSEEPVPESTQVSTDYTQQSSRTVIIKAKTRIILANGFRYKADGDNYLVTQLLPNAKNSNDIDGYTVYPECYSLEVDKQKVNLNNNQVVPNYEIMQPQQGSLLIRNKSFDYNATVKSEHFEIVEMNTGKIGKKGYLSGYETQIDVSDLKGGFYVVKVANGEQVYTQKIVIRN